MSYFFFNFQDFLLKRIVSYLQVSLKPLSPTGRCSKSCRFFTIWNNFSPVLLLFIKIFFAFGSLSFFKFSFSYKPSWLRAGRNPLQNPVVFIGTGLRAVIIKILFKNETRLVESYFWINWRCLVFWFLGKTNPKSSGH